MEHCLLHNQFSKWTNYHPHCVKHHKTPFKDNKDSLQANKILPRLWLQMAFQAKNRGEISGEKERGSDCQLSRLVSIPSYTVRGHNLKLALGKYISEISVLSLLYISSSEAAVIPVIVKSHRIFPKWDPMKRN